MKARVGRSIEGVHRQPRPPPNTPHGESPRAPIGLTMRSYPGRSVSNSRKSRELNPAPAPSLHISDRCADNKLEIEEGLKGMNAFPAGPPPKADGQREEIAVAGCRGPLLIRSLQCFSVIQAAGWRASVCLPAPSCAGRGKTPAPNPKPRLPGWARPFQPEMFCIFQGGAFLHYQADGNPVRQAPSARVGRFVRTFALLCLYMLAPATRSSPGPNLQPRKPSQGRLSLSFCATGGWPPGVLNPSDSSLILCIFDDDRTARSYRPPSRQASRRPCASSSHARTWAGDAGVQSPLLSQDELRRQSKRLKTLRRPSRF